MAEGMNKWIGMGNVGRDPELRTTQGGTSVLKFSLACNERRKDKNGEWGDHCEWINVVVWGKRAEALSKIIGKGSSLLVEGKLRTSSYEAKDGSGKRYSTEVNADNVILCGSKGERRGGGGSHTTQTEDEFAAGDEDCPF